MAVSILETIKSKANSGNTAYIVVLSLLCDTYSDLPTQYGLTGYELAQGCKAHVIDTNSDYMLDSAGTWHIYGGEIWQNVYTKSETDALLDDKQDELTTAQLAAVNSGITAAKLTADESALAEVVDNGAKNIADFTSSTKTTYTTATSHGVTITRNGDIFTVSGTSDTNDNAFFNIYYAGSTSIKIIPPGNWVALIEDYTGSVVNDIAVQIAAPAVPPVKQYGTPIKFSLSGSESGNWLRVNVRPSTTYNGSFRLMICSQEYYAVSPSFVPYRPSWQDMWDMIQALQNGTRSTPALAKALEL